MTLVLTILLIWNYFSHEYNKIDRIHHDFTGGACCTDYQLMPDFVGHADHNHHHHGDFFRANSYASAVLAIVILSVRVIVSIRLFVRLCESRRCRGHRRTWYQTVALSMLLRLSCRRLNTSVYGLYYWPVRCDHCGHLPTRFVCHSVDIFRWIVVCVWRSSFQESMYVVGDFNIRLDRHDDPHTKQFTDLLSTLRFLCLSD